VTPFWLQSRFMAIAHNSKTDFSFLFLGDRSVCKKIFEVCIEREWKINIVQFMLYNIDKFLSAIALKAMQSQPFGMRLPRSKTRSQ
jgi:hypothetical protein